MHTTWQFASHNTFLFCCIGQSAWGAFPIFSPLFAAICHFNNFTFSLKVIHFSSDYHNNILTITILLNCSAIQALRILVKHLKLLIQKSRDSYQLRWSRFTTFCSCCYTFTLLNNTRLVLFCRVPTCSGSL